jgi:hypothetical protein
MIGARAAAQVISVGKAARHNDEVGALGQRRVRVPHHRSVAARGEFQRARHVALAVNARENEDC